MAPAGFAKLRAHLPFTLLATVTAHLFFGQISAGHHRSENLESKENAIPSRGQYFDERRNKLQDCTLCPPFAPMVSECSATKDTVCRCFDEGKFYDESTRKCRQCSCDAHYDEHQCGQYRRNRCFTTAPLTTSTQVVFSRAMQRMPHMGKTAAPTTHHSKSSSLALNLTKTLAQQSTVTTVLPPASDLSSSTGRVSKGQHSKLSIARNSATQPETRQVTLPTSGPPTLTGRRAKTKNGINHSRPGDGIEVGEPSSDTDSLVFLLIAVVFLVFVCIIMAVVLWEAKWRGSHSPNRKFDGAKGTKQPKEYDV